jgi:hypothetical protein
MDSIVHEVDRGNKSFCSPEFFSDFVVTRASLGKIYLIVPPTNSTMLMQMEYSDEFTEGGNG